MIRRGMTYRALESVDLKSPAFDWGKGCYTVALGHREYLYFVEGC